MDVGGVQTTNGIEIGGAHTRVGVTHCGGGDLKCLPPPVYRCLEIFLDGCITANDALRCIYHMNWSSLSEGGGLRTVV